MHICVITDTKAHTTIRKYTINYDLTHVLDIIKHTQYTIHKVSDHDE